MAVQTISSPKNEHVNINIEPGQTIAFDFDISTSSFERTGSDLTINVDGGGQIVLTGFFVGDSSGSLPGLRLEDGTEVASNDFLSAMDPSFDITPAAGPASSSSSGINSYADTAGDLVGGLGGSDSLGGVFWSSQGGVTDSLQSAGTAFPAGGGGGTGPNPVPGNPDYTARAVLYTNNGAADTFNFRLPTGKSFLSASSSDGLVDTSSLIGPNNDGSYSFLTNAMSGTANEYDYITITYIDNTTETIQVILNHDGTYSSAAEDALNPPSAPIGGEWHTQNHMTESTGSRQTSNGNDEIWLTSVMAPNNGQGNVINTGAGQDLVHISQGIQAVNNSNSIRSGTGAGNTMDIGANVHASAAGSNLLESGGITITNNSSTRPTTLSATSSSTNTLLAGQDGIKIASDSTGTNRPMVIEAATGGENTLTSAGSISVSLEGGSGDARGISAVGANSENTLTSTAGGIILNIGQGVGENHSGLYANDSGKNVLQAEGRGTVNIQVQSGGTGSFTSNTYARGVYAEGHGENTVNGYDVKVGAGNSYDTFGLLANDGANTIDAANTIFINAYGAKNLASGVMAENGGTNLLTSAGKITVSGISVGGNGSASALRATENGINILKSNTNIDLMATNAGAHAAGMQALNNTDSTKAHNQVEALNGTVNITVKGGSALGMSAIDDMGGNSIAAEKVVINATGDLPGNKGNATGMQAHAGWNLITANDVTINASTGANGRAYGMSAENGGFNMIEAADSSEALIVTITAQKGALDGFAMFAQTTGMNAIVGGNAGDTITINGKVDIASVPGGINKIDTGKGDDTIILNGKIEEGALQISAGDDYDTLVLKADNITEFNNNYQAWLTDNAPGGTINWDAMSIESVRVEINGDVNLNDLDWLNSVFNGSGTDFIIQAGNGSAMDLMGSFDMGAGNDSFSLVGDVNFQGGVIDGGDGMDTLKVGEMADSTLDLSALAAAVDGFEVIDLTGGSGTTLTIDSLLDELNIDAKLESGSIDKNTSGCDLANGTVLRITGDAGDNVDVSGPWDSTAAGTVEYDGVTYNVYINNNEMDQYLLVQTSLLI